MNIKKLLLLIILLLIPTKIKAEEIEAIIKINNDINEIKENFYFELTDIEGKKIQTIESKEKEIKFNPLKFTEEDIDKTFYYKIIQINKNNINIKYDEEPIYVGIEITKEEETLNANVAYVKLSNYKKQTAKPFYISEKDLEKEAYAEYDTSTKTLTFFRDEKNKYTDNQIIGDKIYYTGIENINIRNQWNNNITNEVYNYEIKKIVTKDPIKPKKINNLFGYLQELEEIDISKMDTSELTNLSYFLEEANKLKTVDISTMDTSNVTDMKRIFRNSKIEILDFTLWNMDKTGINVMESVSKMPNLKYLDISNWGPIDSSAEFADLPCLEVVKLGNRFKFSRSTLGEGDYQFLRLEDNKVIKSEELEIPSTVEIGNIAGTYIRPSCTKEASFKNVYQEAKKEEEAKNNSEPKEEKIINPPTGTFIKLLLIGTISLISIINIFKTKKILH